VTSISRFAATFVIAAVAAAPATAQPYNCLPSCSSVDGRFLAVANGTGFVTLSEPVLDLEISVPAGTTNFSVGVFDGDSRGVDATLTPHWDLGTAGAIFTYTLYADPLGNRTGTTVVPLGGLPFQSSTTMPDNGWIDFTVNTGAAAQAPSGNYFYLLRIQLTAPAVTLNAFKVRTGGAQVGGSSLFPAPKPFSYIANATSTTDIGIVYPGFPALTPTFYDGTFSFYFDQPVSAHDITVWDGDFDHGKFDGTEGDTNDPDTPDAPFRPVWATSDTVSEGVAVGLSGSTGNPPDDRNPASTGIYLLKTPSIRYDLIFPDTRTFANNNPSGNQEWEQFKVSTAPFNSSQMDYSTPTIPPGTYELEINGVDMLNLNALLLPFRVLCVDELGVVCQDIPRPFRVGDTVFEDRNGNGRRDPGEPGLAGQRVSDGRSIVLTDAQGRYALPAAEEAVRAAHRLTGVLSHRSAALRHGWELKTVPAQPDVTVRRNRTIAPDRRAGVALHRADLRAAELHPDGICTSVERTLVDCLRSLPFDEALAVADSALRHRSLAKTRLVELADGIRGPGAPQARDVAREASGLAANPFESALRAIAENVKGLHVEPQVWLQLDGEWMRPDLLDARHRLIIEAESFEWHGKRRSLERDCVRYNAFALVGYTVLRFSWEQVMFQPEYVERCLRGFLTGPRPVGRANGAESARWSA